ncbi:MAG: peptidylprolyl isomerase [Catalinimonas sp.]
MKKLFLLLLIVLPAACGGPPPGEQAEVTEVPPEPPQEDTLLNAETAVSYLTRYAEQHPDSLVAIDTRLGTMVVRLYDDTPLHRANFLRLVERGYYDECVFYRVIRNFMIQGGNSGRRSVKIGSYKLPAEIRPHHLHKRGALAMAAYEQDSTERLSSSKDFYIVQGERYTPRVLRATEEQTDLALTPQQRRVYTTVGGAPHLDGDYTVFGEVVVGMDVIDSIAALPVDSEYWPLQDVRTPMRIIPTVDAAARL